MSLAFDRFGCTFSQSLVLGAGATTMKQRSHFAVLAAVSLAGYAAPARGGDLDFVTIGSPGNRATNPSEVPSDPDLRIGAVPYEYRISRTEVTVSQYYEFVQGYAPYWTGSRLDSAFTSRWIVPDSLDPNQPASYHMVSGAEQLPADMSWRMAARFCNWHMNGKGSSQAAFESGAYDTSTFGTDSSGHVTDQLKHSPGAKFWIPTVDEWTKAAYYDPDRYGAGEGGYWRFPDKGNDPLVPGPPGIGETNAGTWDGDTFGFYNVGSYPTVQSPWGLLDCSGGVSELTEGFGQAEYRQIKGSHRFGLVTDYFDEISGFAGVAPDTGMAAGFRIAAVPNPGTLSVILVTLFRRRRR